MDKTDLLEKSRNFCMLPWTHLHIWPNSAVYPCCIASSEESETFGNLQNASLTEIWNSEKIRKMRQNMLQGKDCQECRKCYELEESRAFTLRKRANQDFNNHWNIVESTAPDGRVDKLNLIYLDIRFSNLCNLKCRSCGPESSSAWWDDMQALGHNHYKKKVVQIKDSDPNFLEKVIQLLDQVEEIYFAGGEPLFMEEHHAILQALVEKKRFDLRLTYNTNFSKLTYKQTNFLDIWKHFSSVTIGASLDASGKQAEYLRHGCNWPLIEKNRKLLQEQCPKVKFHICATISIFNIFHIFDFYFDWLKRGFITPNEFFANLLTEPEEFRIQILPLAQKQKIAALIDNSILRLNQEFDTYSGSSIESFKSIKHFLFAEDKSAKQTDFQNKTESIDRIRKENYREIFPEFNSIFP